jgi:hypothetical protein
VPLLPENALENAASASGTAALGLVKADALVASGGTQKALLEQARSTLKAGQPGGVVQSGQIEALGPVKLPVLTSGKDYLGGQAPLVVGTRRALDGTSYEVIALASTKLIGTLAAYQRTALFGLAGLLVLSLVWTVLMGSGQRGAPQDSSSGGDTLGLSSAMANMAATQAPAPQAQSFASPSSELPPTTHPGLELTASAPVGGSANDFPFAPPPSTHGAAMAPPLPTPAPFAFAPPPQQQPRPFDAQGYGSQPPDSFGEPSGDPFSEQPYGNPPTPFDSEPLPSTGPDGVATASPRAGAFHFEELPTAAYSLQQAADPYAAASAMGSGLGNDLHDENPETTRVAAIPRELLQASARPPTQEMPLPAQFAPPPPAPSVAPVPWGEPAQPAQPAIPLPGAAYQQFLGNTGDSFSEEEFHFQEVFREFVLTRERCSEPSDGLTYDKFVQKLRKNKDQLVQKYACRTVKFQVYVKEGKAALKATPVKD